METATDSVIRERPILFSGPMVRAILDGRKTQTRRLVKCPPPADFTGKPVAMDFEDPAYWAFGFHHITPEWWPGQMLWVKETYIRGGNGKPLHCADADPNELGLAHENGFRKTPSIFMRRWESRLSLEITGVRPERLTSITETDAVAEGIRGWYTTGNPKPVSWMLGPDDRCKPFYDGRTGWHPSATAQDAYRRLWESINGRGSWAANPWVWVIEFKPINPKTPTADEVAHS